MGYRHRPIDKSPLFNYLGLWHVNHGLTLIISLFYLVQTSFREFGEVSLSTYLGYIRFYRNWSGSLAKRRLCPGPAGVINYTPLSALPFWVSLFPGTCGYNIDISNFLEETSSLSILLFSFISLHCSFKIFLSFLAILWNSAFSWVYLIAYGEQCRIHDFWRRRFNFRTRDQAWSLKSFCVAEFY